MIQLTARPKEGSTYVISVAFKDVDGTPFVPLTCFWSLTDGKGATIINGRDRVPVIVSETTHHFVLSGADLLYAVGLTKGSRVFSVEGTYDSVYEDDVPYREEVGFTITDTVVNPL